jgi:hypothetical protein
MARSVSTIAFPLAGIVVSCALYRSYPAANADPLVGALALSDIFLTRRGGAAEMLVVRAGAASGMVAAIVVVVTVVVIEAVDEGSIVVVMDAVFDWSTLLRLGRGELGSEGAVWIVGDLGGEVVWGLIPDSDGFLEETRCQLIGLRADWEGTSTDRGQTTRRIACIVQVRVPPFANPKGPPNDGLGSIWAAIESRPLGSSSPGFVRKTRRPHALTDSRCVTYLGRARAPFSGWMVREVGSWKFSQDHLPPPLAFMRLPR